MGISVSVGVNELTLMLLSREPVTRCTSSNWRHVTAPVWPTNDL